MSAVVGTTSGNVRGALRDGIAAWRGIPYARAPRFKPPEPYAGSGELDATKFGPVAIQSRDPRSSMMSGITAKTEMAEECLVLNVFAPVPDGRLRPVMVWIHGGAFIMGSSSQPLYNGTAFARDRDVVVVSINYRLGLLGLMYFGDLLGEDYAAGNVALLDQVAALRWVRDNIAGFGGDPDHVTVMGESAGAVSVANLLAMPAAKGLFHRAILQSGAFGLSPPTRADASELARAVCTGLGMTPQQVLDASVDQLLVAQETASRTHGLGTFSPYVDGVTIPRSPLDIVRDGDGSRVPVMLGSNRDEWTLFDVFIGPAATAVVVGQLRKQLGPIAEQLHAAYLAARPEHSPERAWVDAVGDVAFRIPMIKLAELQARHAPVWMYRFDWATPAFDGRLGAAHALELPFVWDTIDAQFSQLLLGGDPSAKPLAVAMQVAWSAFIHGGEPAAPGLPAWPTYDGERRATMLLDRTPRVVDDPAGTLRALYP